MNFLEFASGPFSVQLFGITLSLGLRGVAEVMGWMLFASGAFFAVRERVTGKRSARWRRSSLPASRSPR